MVVGDEPGVCFGLELADRGEVTTMKGRAPALLGHGALEPFADGIVVGGSVRDAVAPQPLGGQGVDEGAGYIFAPVVRQDCPDPHPVTAIEAQGLGDEAGPSRHRWVCRARWR